MTVPEAILLADKIAWGYMRAGKYTSHINLAIANGLGPKKYSLFCEKINADPRLSVEKAQQENFLLSYLDNPTDAISDFAVKTNWSLRKIFQIISEII